LLSAVTASPAHSQSSQSGQATITVTVDQGGRIIEKQFSFKVVPASQEPPPWLVMLYLAGDDISPQGQGQVGLTEPLNELLAHLRSAAPNPAIRLVVLFDGDQAGDSALYVREPGLQGLQRPRHQRSPIGSRLS
jgi:hypothetical protein